MVSHRREGRRRGESMQAVCGSCGEAMIQGDVATSEDHESLSFIVRSGTPTSMNPIKAVMQGVRQEPAYREESCSIRGRACPRCGRFEFCIDAADLARLSAVGGPPGAQ